MFQRTVDVNMVNAVTHNLYLGQTRNIGLETCKTSVNIASPSRENVNVPENS